MADKFEQLTTKQFLYWYLLVQIYPREITAGITKLESNQETKYVNNKELNIKCLELWNESSIVKNKLKTETSIFQWE